MSGTRVREMTLDDCARVAEIRVRGWRTAYEGLIPRSYLDGLSVPEDAARRRRTLEQGDGVVVNLVAERDGSVVGWACHGPHRDSEARSGEVELYAIYVHPDVLGQGVGQALLRESADRCAAAGHERMLLWVLKENAPARRFYEKAGFRPDGAEEPFEADGVAVPEVRYARVLTGGGAD
ncbi:GNAT family N-acetyltransferase [Streptomyces populi]|uniref:GNAT family N-acetyltransferase n=2 Tax=Streptomyces populi TaxID=2058924 RepID=A0A2I0SM74_9ACTN|nr:GNAT family N-acetyltransferase [Streptomyces populi]PKT71045.1 GNAT family N-acetyltransferase [Streptomyces populi]